MSVNIPKVEWSFPIEMPASVGCFKLDRRVIVIRIKRSAGRREFLRNLRRRRG
jgi:hypothetical protein